MDEIVPSLIVSYRICQSQTTSIETRIKQISLWLQIKHSGWIKLLCVFTQHEMSTTAMFHPKSEPNFYLPNQETLISI